MGVLPIAHMIDCEVCASKRGDSNYADFSQIFESTYFLNKAVVILFA